MCCYSATGCHWDVCYAKAFVAIVIIHHIIGVVVGDVELLMLTSLYIAVNFFVLHTAFILFLFLGHDVALHGVCLPLSAGDRFLAA